MRGVASVTGDVMSPAAIRTRGRRPRGAIPPGRSYILPPMRLVVALTTGLVLWIVVWAITGRGFDSMLVLIAILLLAGTTEIALRYLPGRR